MKGFRNVQGGPPSLCQVLFSALTPMTSSTPAGGACCPPGRSRKGPPGPGHPLPCRRLLGPPPRSGHQREEMNRERRCVPARADPQPPGPMPALPAASRPRRGVIWGRGANVPCSPPDTPSRGAHGGPVLGARKGPRVRNAGLRAGARAEAAGRRWPRRFWTQPPQNPEPFSGSGAPPRGQSLHRVGRPPRTPRPWLLRSVPFHPLPHPTGGL